MYTIKTGSVDDSKAISKIIRISNCETGIKDIKNSMLKGNIFFILIFNGDYIGVISLYKVSTVRPIIKNFAILPHHQKKGLGLQLIKYVENYARSLNKEKISLGVMAYKTKLVAWYKNCGFYIYKVKKYKHFKCEILFMIKSLT